MLKDVTLGQFFPGDTIVHRLDPRTKLLWVILYIVALFNAYDWTSYALVLAVTAACIAASKIRPATILRGLKPLILVIALTAVLNIFYTDGTPVLPGWIITWEGIKKAFLLVLRIMIGREEELERVIQILNRRQKNNPCLIGEPGVGKTAIAEGLAQRIVRGQVPYKLREKEVYLLDLTALVAGTQFRGQFESRMASPCTARAIFPGCWKKNKEET